MNVLLQGTRGGVEWEWHWRGDPRNVGAPWVAGVKMFRVAQLNVLTPKVKKAGSPHYRLMCHRLVDMGFGDHKAGGDEVWSVRPGGSHLGKPWGFGHQDRIPPLCPAQAHASYRPAAAPSLDLAHRLSQGPGAIRPTLDTQRTVCFHCSSVVLVKCCSADLVKIRSPTVKVR